MEPTKAKKKINTNQILSSFLVIAYVVCMFFIEQMVNNLENVYLRNVLTILMYVIFGLLLFYATRVGDGKQITRFSLSVLLLMVVPGLYIVLCIFFPTLPLASQVLQSNVVTLLGLVMLGYGIPYTFTSGYERMEEESVSVEDEEYIPGSTLDVTPIHTDEEGDALKDEAFLDSQEQAEEQPEPSETQTDPQVEEPDTETQPSIDEEKNKG